MGGAINSTSTTEESVEEEIKSMGTRNDGDVVGGVPVGQVHPDNPDLVWNGGEYQDKGARDRLKAITEAGPGPERDRLVKEHQKANKDKAASDARRPVGRWCRSLDSPVRRLRANRDLR